MDIAELQILIEVNDAQAQARFQSMDESLQVLANRALASENTTSGAMQRTQTATGNFTGALNGLSAVAMGLPAQFQPAVGALSGLQNSMYASQGMAEGVGKKLFVAGAGLTAAGAGFQLFAGPLEDATNKLDQAVKNSNNNVGDWSGKLKAAQKSGEDLGFTHAQVNEGLARLVTGFGNTKQALKYFGEEMDLARYKNVSLEQSGKDMIRIYEGYGRGLKELGINMTFTHNAQKGLESANTQAGNAVDRLASQTSKYNQTLETLAAKQQGQAAAGNAAALRAAEALATANERAAYAQTKVNDAAGVSPAKLAGVESAQRSLASANLAAEKAQLRVNAANDYAAAHGEQNATAVSKLQAAHLSAESAAQRVAAAQERVNQANERANQPSAALTNAQRSLALANEAVAKAQEKADATAKNANGTTLQAIRNQQQLANATDAVNKAKEVAGKAASNVAEKTKAVENEKTQGTTALDLVETTKVHGQAKAAADSTQGNLRQIKAQVEDFLATTGEKFGGLLLTAGPAMSGIGAIMQAHPIKGLHNMIDGLGKLASKFIGAGADAAESMTGVTAAVEAADVAETEGAVATTAMFAPWLLGIAALAAVGVAIYEVVTHFQEIIDFASGVLDWVKGHWVDILGTLLLGPLWLFRDQIFDVVSKAWNFAVGVFNGAVDWVKSHWKDIVGTLLLGPLWLFRDQISSVLDKAFNFIVGGFYNILTFIGSIPGRMVDMLKGLYDNAVDLGKHFVNGLIHGIENLAGSLWSGIKNLAVKALDELHLGWLISSPSRKTHEAGKHFVDGIIRGIDERSEHLNSRVRKLAREGLGGLGGSYAFDAGGSISVGGGGGQGQTPITVNVGGSVIGQQQLAEYVRQYLISKGQGQGGKILGGFA